VNLDLSTPLELIGRPAEFQRIVQLLAQDGDLLIAGVPGSGRAVVRRAAREVERSAEVDCIRPQMVSDLCNCCATLLARCSRARRLLLIQKWIAQPACEFLSST